MKREEAEELIINIMEKVVQLQRHLFTHRREIDRYRNIIQQYVRKENARRGIEAAKTSSTSLK